MKISLSNFDVFNGIKVKFNRKRTQLQNVFHLNHDLNVSLTDFVLLSELCSRPGQAILRILNQFCINATTCQFKTHTRVIDKVIHRDKPNTDDFE